MMTKRMVIFISVLILLLVSAVGYIAYDKYSDWRMTKDIALYQEGASYGYEQAIIGVAQEVSKCSQAPVPLRVGNQTINVFAVECVNQQAAAQ